MRRLWITRRKASVAGGLKMNVYIEDPAEGDTEIGGCLCRKLGELKNDQQKHFTIGTEAARICVVAQKGSKYPEFLEIPEGEDDVCLSGRNCRDAALGNPFRFDGEEQEAPQEVRKSGGRKGWIILIAAIVVGILAGAGVGVAVSSSLLGGSEKTVQTVQEQSFRCGDLQITLPEGFAETSAPGYTTCYSDGETAVFLLREGFDAREGFGDLTLEDYGAMVLASNHMDQEVQLQTRDGLTTFEKTITVVQTETSYHYYCGLYKAADAFWMVQITSPAEEAQERIPQFRQWLQSVAFAS